MIMQLNKTILSLQKTIEDMNAREAAVLQENQVLKEQIDYLTKKLFGKSSEKNVCDIEGQMTLFNELEKEMPVLEAFWSWFDKQHAVKGSRMEKALTYIQNRRPYMMTYLDDGRCSFCNNLSEIEIKPIALGRKNYLFSDTPAGAEASAVIYSLVETAKANNLNVLQYLRYLLEELPKTDMTEEAFERYLPWNPDVKSDMEERATKLLEE